MEVNMQNQCVRVYFDDQVINVQPLVVLTQDLTGVAQQDTLVQGISDIRDDISNINIDTSDLAKQGISTSATLTDTQAYALAAKTAAEAITIPTDYAKQGSNTSATNTAILSAIGNISIDTTTLAQRTDVKDGNDTAISVSKETRSEVGTGSDTAAESGTLFAILKWVKDKVKSIFQLIGSPESGQPSTLFAAIAAGGGGGGSAATPSEAVDDSVASKALDPNKLYIFTNRTNNLTITLNAGEAGDANEYHFFIEVGATLPTITFPNTIGWVFSAPSMAINSTYEISILNNSAICVQRGNI